MHQPVIFIGYLFLIQSSYLLYGWFTTYGLCI